MKALITGGGTGGHIYPALSVADELKDRGWDIEYVGSSNSLEEEILSNTEYTFNPIKVLPLPRSINLKLFKSFFISIKAIFKSYKLIKKIKPDIVFGTGGYVTGPVLIGAFLGKIPTVIHEQNIYPGITNKILSFFVTKIAVTNIDAKKYFNKRVRAKIVQTGNPIRKKIVQTDRITGLKNLKLSMNKKTLLIMGGSQGSETINNAFSNTAARLLKDNNLQVIIITGKDNYDSFINKNKYVIENNSKSLKVLPYLNNIEWAYAAADLIIYRAGATGLAEITGCGLPAILVPYPYSAEDHQKYNAEFMERSGAAIMVEDNKLTGDKLNSIINNIIFDDNKLREMSKKCKKLANLNASEKIVDIIEEKAGE